MAQPHKDIFANKDVEFIDLHGVPVFSSNAGSLSVDLDTGKHYKQDSLSATTKWKELRDSVNIHYQDSDSSEFTIYSNEQHTVFGDFVNDGYIKICGDFTTATTTNGQLLIFNGILDTSGGIIDNEGIIDFKTYAESCDSSGSFTGNTSATCISDIWVTNIHPCSALTIFGEVQEGNNTRAAGQYSHSEGDSSYVGGLSSHVEGGYNYVAGAYSHGEGRLNVVGLGTYNSISSGYGTDSLVFDGDLTGNYLVGDGVLLMSTQSGYENISQSGIYSVSYDTGTTQTTIVLTSSSGYYDNFLFNTTQNISDYGHAEGFRVIASAAHSHAEGIGTTASGDYSHAEGFGTYSTGNRSHSEGSGSRAIGDASHAEGQNTYSVGQHSHSEGAASSKFSYTLANGSVSHAEGYGTMAYGDYSHTQNNSTVAASPSSMAEGYLSLVGLSYVGYYTDLTQSVFFNNFDYTSNFTPSDQLLTIDGMGSILTNTVSSVTFDLSGTTLYLSSSLGGDYDIKVVNLTTSNALTDHAGHAEGYLSRAIGQASHAEGGNGMGGQGTVAFGAYSHGEGESTLAYGQSSHSEGSNTMASGVFSHSQNYQTIAATPSSTSEGYLSVAGLTYDGVYTDINKTIFFACQDFANTNEFTVNDVILIIDVVGYGIVSNMSVVSSVAYDSDLSGTTLVLNISLGGDYVVRVVNLTTSNALSIHSGHAEGGGTVARGLFSHAEGRENISNGDYSHSEGERTTSSGNHSHAEGYKSYAFGESSHVEGAFNISGLSYESISSGAGTDTIVISGLDVTDHYGQNERVILRSSSGYVDLKSNMVKMSSFDGNDTTIILNSASGYYDEKIFSEKTQRKYTHAEGFMTVSSDYGSHSEGNQTSAIGKYSHSEGCLSISYGIGSHTEGSLTLASGDYSHAGGCGYVDGPTVFNVIAGGKASFNHSSVDINYTGSGATGDYSSILGGINNSVNHTGSVILGCSGVTSDDEYTTYINNLKVLGSTNIKPYKVYTALLTQTGATDPIVTVLENTFNNEIIWTRDGVGEFIGTLSGAFIGLKTFISATSKEGNFIIGGERNNNDDEIYLSVYDVTTANYADGLGSNPLYEYTSIEIRVYN